MAIKMLQRNSVLPLTCSRSGSCCHGNLVRLNPWELTQLAYSKGCSTRFFRDHFTSASGSILSFTSETTFKGKNACNLYQQGKGCSVHPNRPLACRLFPLARHIQHETVEYIFQGDEFPCLTNCPEVIDLPEMSVEHYLKGQETTKYEFAHDAYLEVMQNCADMALTIVLETELINDTKFHTLSCWDELANLQPENWAIQLGNEWIDLLMTPEIQASPQDPSGFIEEHNDLIQAKAQAHFAQLNSLKELHYQAVDIMALTLFLAHLLGADVRGLMDWWIEIAKENGAIKD